MQNTLAIIKPDAVRKNKIGAIVAMAEDAGLKVLGLQATQLTESFWREFYAEHTGKAMFEPLVEFMASGTVVLMVLEGEDAVTKWRSLMGATDSSKAAPGTIRALYGNPLVIRENAVHGSDSSLGAVRELSLIVSR